MTRYLTPDEIEDIVDFIKPVNGIPIESAISIAYNNKERFRKQLKTQKVYSEIIPKLKEIIKKTYFQSIITPGESVGIICAQSIGEKNTQSMLNTFHKAGQSEKQTLVGVPRLQELLNATKDPKITSSKIFFNKKHATLEDTRETVGHKFVELTFSKISKNIEVCMSKKPETWYKAFDILYQKESWYHNIEKYENCISIKLNMDMLYEYKLTTKDISEYIHREYNDLFCIFSPDSIGQIDIYVDTTSISLPENRLLFIDKSNAKEIYLEETVQPILEKMVISGIPNIENIYYSQDNNEWIIETDGNNFKSILAQDDVDENRTISNNVWDIYEIFGIEAAKRFLIEEFMNIMEGINFSHSKLLVDRMTFNGTISSISRYTMRSDECGPLGKLSFEESCETLMRAGSTGETDNMKGVSASIIAGKKANIGTGMMDLHIDMKMLSKFPFIKEVKEEK